MHYKGYRATKEYYGCLEEINEIVKDNKLIIYGYMQTFETTANVAMVFNSIYELAHAYLNDNRALICIYENEKGLYFYTTSTSGVMVHCQIKILTPEGYVLYKANMQITLKKEEAKYAKTRNSI